MEVTKQKEPLFKSAPNEPLVKELEFLEDEFRISSTGAPTEKMGFYPDIMHRKVAFRKQVIPPSYKQIRFMVVVKLFGIDHTALKHYLWIGRRVRPAKKIHKCLQISRI